MYDQFFRQSRIIITGAIDTRQFVEVDSVCSILWNRRATEAHFDTTHAVRIKNCHEAAFTQSEINPLCPRRGAARMRHTFSVLCLSVVLFGFHASNGFAESIPWKYNWSRSHAKVFADAPGTGFISLTDESLKGARGSSDIVATNLRIHSTASPLTPDTFTNADYSLTLFLLDEGSGQSGTLHFGGEFNGSVSKLSSNLTHTFTGTTTKSIGLGTSLYTVSIGPYTPPGPPGSANAGAVSAAARVEVSSIEQAPEPSTLILTGIAVPFLSYAAWRRRRNVARHSVS